MSEATPIGTLRTRLVLEAPQRADDGGGGASVAWETVGEVWADLRAASGDESYALDRLAGSVSHVVVMRYRAGVTPQMRLRLDARVFDIRAAFDPDGRRTWTRCLVAERDL